MRWGQSCTSSCGVNICKPGANAPVIMEEVAEHLKEKLESKVESLETAEEK